ncbi:MAG: hypothetical protein HYZ26_05345 [Chloroflexi bacterium]|nr:hypothetical protein [Chloroflexota bacterium]
MLRRRVALFMTVMAVAVLALFFSSDVAGRPNFWLLLSGIVLGGLAIGLWRGGRQPPAPSQRFRLMRRLFGGKPPAPPPSAPPSAPPAQKRGLFGRKK